MIDYRKIVNNAKNDLSLIQEVKPIKDQKRFIFWYRYVLTLTDINDCREHSRLSRKNYQDREIKKAVQKCKLINASKFKAHSMYGYLVVNADSIEDVKRLILHAR